MTALSDSESVQNDLAADMCNGVEEIAEFTGEKIRATYHQCANGQLPAFKFAGQWRMRKSAYLELVERLERKALDQALMNAGGR